MVTYLLFILLNKVFIFSKKTMITLFCWAVEEIVELKLGPANRKSLREIKNASLRRARVSGG